MAFDGICVPLAHGGTYVGNTLGGRCRRIAECGVSRQVANRCTELEVDHAVGEKVFEHGPEGKLDGTSGGQEVVNVAAKVLEEPVHQLSPVGDVLGLPRLLSTTPTMG